MMRTPTSGTETRKTNRPRFFLMTLAVSGILLAGPAWAANAVDLSQAAPPPGGMCTGQAPVSEKEMGKALAVLADLQDMGGKLSPGDEETFIRGQGLTSDRMNCILGKLMAGNDIFGWGAPEAYGVSLSPEELAAARKFSKDSAFLRKYLEENLNIKVE